MASDPFGLGGSIRGLDPNDLESMTPFALQARDNTLAIIQTVFGRDADIIGTQVNATTGLDLESALVGDFFLLEVHLQTEVGETLPCLSFVNRDEMVAGFDLDLPVDLSDWSEQVARLQNPFELLAEAINAQLTALGPSAPTLVRPTVRALSLPEESSSLLLAPEEQLVEVSFRLDVLDVGELTVVTIAAVDFVRYLAAAERGETLRPAGPVAAAPRVGGTTVDDLAGLGLGPDPFAGATGRTSADILGDFDAAGTGRGATGQPPSMAGYGSGRAAPEAVRPAHFQQFGEAADPAGTSNIDIIMDVNLRITVELGRTSMSIRDILELGPGAVVELDKLAGEPVDILVNDKAIAKGEVVVVDENFGVRVTDIISPARRVASLR